MERFLKENGFVKMCCSKAYSHPDSGIIVRQENGQWVVSATGNNSMKLVEHWKNKLEANSI